MGQKPTTGQSANKTPDDFKQYKDARKNQGAGTYPNAWRRKTRSGHLLEFDDSKDAEHITLQHRSGAMIQFLPDGAVHYTSFNGQQNVVFGENRIYITGAHDVVVDGDSSMKTKGDSNETTYGGKYVATEGPHVVTAKSHNANYEEQNDVMCKSCATTATEGMTLKSGKTMSLTATGSVLMGSDNSGVAIRGRTAGLRGETQLALESKGQTHILSTADISVDTGGKIYFNSNKAQPIKNVVKVG